jgi:NADP-dependent 3-hydroxy acid dehydrogenase YdfG
MSDGLETAEAAAGRSEERPDLRGKVAVITGASGGIGAAIARALAERGARLALSARRAEPLEALAERLRAEHAAEVLALPGDVRDEPHVEGLVRAALERWGQIDILVPNAGAGYRAPIAAGDPTRWKQLLDVNVYGVLLTLRYGVPPMLARHAGHVVLLSSVAGRVTQAANGVYSATKCAVNAIAEALRQEVTREGVRVTWIEPGVVATAFQDVAGYSSELRRRLLEEQRPLSADDVARAVIFALEQPAHVSINELLIRPSDQVSA